MTFDAECREICFVRRKTSVMTLMSWDFENVMRFIFSGTGPGQHSWICWIGGIYWLYKSIETSLKVRQHGKPQNLMGAILSIYIYYRTVCDFLDHLIYSRFGSTLDQIKTSLGICIICHHLSLTFGTVCLLMLRPTQWHSKTYQHIITVNMQPCARKVHKLLGCCYQPDWGTLCSIYRKFIFWLKNLCSHSLSAHFAARCSEEWWI